jgi:Secretion system C-terminal sorting domain
MKKIIIALLAISSCSIYSAQAQVYFSSTVAAIPSIVPGLGDTLRFSVKPSADTTTGFADVEFFLRYPTSTPAFTFGAVTPNTSNFPGMGTWVIAIDEVGVVEAGFHVAHFIYTAPSLPTTPSPYTSGTSYSMISVPLSGNGLGNFELISEVPVARYYYAITADQNNYDYTPPSTSNYYYPSTSSAPDAVDALTTDYFMALTNVVLPVKFISFSATPKDGDAVLNWTVANEGTTSKDYKVERSTDNGETFVTIDTIAITNPNATSNSYTYIDATLAGAKAASGTVYYHIEQVDKDGADVFSSTQSINFSTAVDLALNVYPNPVKDYATVQFNLDEDAAVTLNVTDLNGRTLQSTELQGVKGQNIPVINLSNFTNGNYVLNLNIGTTVHSFPLIKTN